MSAIRTPLPTSPDDVWELHTAELQLPVILAAIGEGSLSIAVSSSPDGAFPKQKT